MNLRSSLSIRTSCILALVLISACKHQSALRPIDYEQNQVVSKPCPSDLPNTGEDICALYQVPLNWQEPSQRKINVFLRAFPLKKSNPDKISKGQIWLIDGGPGASGSSFSDPKFVEKIHSLGWDLYIPTHRGIGYSTHLDCGINYQTFDGNYASTCSQILLEKYGKDTNWFSAIGAAHDLNYLIDINNTKNQKVVLIGASYGSFLSQRFVQLFESTIDAAILISGTNLNTNFEHFSAYEESTFKRLLEICDQQQGCSRMFPNSTYEAAQSLFIDDKYKECEISAQDSRFSSWVLGSLASLPSLRQELAVSIKRLLRCNTDDVKALQKTLVKINSEKQRQAEQLFQFNPLMLHHQLFVDLMSPEDTIIPPLFSEKPVLLGARANDYYELRYEWPWRLPPLQLPAKLDANLPILALHGGLDMQGPLTWFVDLNSQLNKSNQYAILFDTAGHGTPHYTQINEDTNCSWQIIENFLNLEGVALDTSCVDAVKPFTFKLEP